MRISTLAVGIVGLLVGAVIGAFVFTTFQQPVTPPPPPQKGPCSSDPNDHCIDVNVVMVNGKPQISTIADEYVKKQGAIFWSIKTPGYSFPANGIDFVDNVATTKGQQYVAPAGEFNCQPMPNPVTFKCVDTHQHYNPPVTYGYQINVDNPAGTHAASLDPFVINGP